MKNGFNNVSFSKGLSLKIQDRAVYLIGQFTYNSINVRKNIIEEYI